MSTEPPASAQQETVAAEPCMACRGTGQVISHLGGGTSTVACPWCRGGGVRLPDVDAQEAWLEAGGGASGAPGAPEGGDAPPDPPGDAAA